MVCQRNFFSNLNRTWRTSTFWSERYSMCSVSWCERECDARLLRRSSKLPWTFIAGVNSREGEWANVTVNIEISITKTWRQCIRQVIRVNYLLISSKQRSWNIWADTESPDVAKTPYSKDRRSCWEGAPDTRQRETVRRAQGLVVAENCIIADPLSSIDCPRSPAWSRSRRAAVHLSADSQGQESPDEGNGVWAQHVPGKLLLCCI